MKYTKPVLVELPGAMQSIQSGVEKKDTFTDSVNPNHPMNATSAAYEADE
jgi:hypothetical protein